MLPVLSVLSLRSLRQRGGLTSQPSQPHKTNSGAKNSLFLVAFALGVICLQQQAALPETPLLWLFSGLILTLLTFCLKRRPVLLLLLVVSLFAGGLTGWGYAAWRADLRLRDRLTMEWEGRDVRVVGTVASLPAQSRRGERFDFQVEQVLTEGATLPEHLWLSFYTPRGAIERLPAAGERWEITVRLKRPHGSQNPYGFDYEAWLLERGVGATGYVRHAPAPRFLEKALWPPMLTIHRLRAHLRERFRASLGEDKPYAGILIALAIGDQYSVSRQQWDVFNRTGTTHLMSISGLHITLAAGLAAWLIGMFWRRHARLCCWLSAQEAAVCGGAVTALAYGLLSGFSVPAARATMMLIAAALAIFSRRQTSLFRVLLFALFVVLLFDPWASLAPGFWLSFGIVAALCWAGRRYQANETKEADEMSEGGFFQRRVQRLLRWARLFSVTQWTATLATLPMLLLFFQRFPLCSPLANLIAIPWIGSLITPLALLSALFVWIPALSEMLLQLAHGLLILPMALLGGLAESPQFSPPAAPLWASLLAALGVVILLLPRGFPGRMAGVLLLLPQIFYPPLPALPEGSLRMTVFDVGQGQGVLLETARHRMLYDAGPVYGIGEKNVETSDAGQRVILPYLAARGIRALDRVIVSHKDNDHSGGLESLRAGIPIAEIFSSIPELKGGKLCRQGENWQWDGVRFEFLHPEGETVLRGENDDSCVLKIIAPGGRTLLTGDISKRVEKRLLARDRANLSAEILLLPHHGSRTSSSWPFVAAVGADFALVSAGYRNRFSHPRPEIVERYETLDARLLRTDRDGALILTLHPKAIETERWREREKRYWRAVE